MTTWDATMLGYTLIRRAASRLLEIPLRELDRRMLEVLRRDHLHPEADAPQRLARQRRQLDTLETHPAAHRLRRGKNLRSSVMRVADVVSRLAEKTHPERAAAWDAVGLHVGDPQAEVRSIAVVHEVTEGVVHQLESSPVDLVVSYHPLVFRPTGRLVPERSPSGRAVRLLRSGVAVAVTHSDFDVMPGGMSDAMADALGLTDVGGFAPVVPRDQVKIVTFVPAATVAPIVDAVSASGAGHIGDYEGCAFTVEGTGRFVAGERTNPSAGEAGMANEEPEVRVEMVAPRSRADQVIAALLGAHPYEEPAFDVYATESNLLPGGRIGTFEGSWIDLVAKVHEAFAPEALRVSSVDAVPPLRVAVSPGAGESRIAPAVAAGADVLVSGDISHHRMVEANDRGLSVIDAGHAATERPGMARLRALVAEIVAEEIGGFVDLYEGETR